MSAQPFVGDGDVGARFGQVIRRSSVVLFVNVRALFCSSTSRRRSGMATRHLLDVVERRLHPVVVAAAVALGVGSIATYQISHRPPATPGSGQRLEPVRFSTDNRPKTAFERLQRDSRSSDVEQRKESVNDLPAQAVRADAFAGSLATPSAEDPTNGVDLVETGAHNVSDIDDKLKPSQSTKPVYRLEEIARHNKPDDIWVIFEGTRSKWCCLFSIAYFSTAGAVYDVTEFVPMHPGGAKILLAAGMVKKELISCIFRNCSDTAAIGKHIEPFWSMYRVHNTPETRELLEEYRIGVLAPEDCIDMPDLSDPYSTG